MAGCTYHVPGVRTFQQDALCQALKGDARERGCTYHVPGVCAFQRDALCQARVLFSEMFVRGCTCQAQVLLSETRRGCAFRVPCWERAKRDTFKPGTATAGRRAELRHKATLPQE